MDAREVVIEPVPDEGDEVAEAEWESAWSAEIDRRVAEVDGGAELLDGDQVIVDARAWLDAQRPL